MKIIHQTAPADKTKWHPIWFTCQQSWLTNFPDYEYRMWTDEDLDELIKTKFPWFYETFTGYPNKINRIDAARYFILYEYGGIYADMDFECLKNFESLITWDNVSIAESPCRNEGETHQNALMISPPKHRFWLKVFKLLDKNKKQPNVLYCTGPQIIIEAIREVGATSLAAEQFAPLYTRTNKPVWKGGQLESAKDNVYTRHHGTAVWNYDSDFNKKMKFLLECWKKL